MCRQTPILAAALCLGMAVPVLAEDAARPTLDALKVRLFYATTGVLSENIASPANFAIWNTGIGEGDAKQPADDLLVSAHLSIKGDEANTTVPLSIKVTGKNGRVVAQRKFSGQFFKSGHTVQALYVQDVACAGPLQIEAVLGNQKKSVTVDMACGE